LDFLNQAAGPDFVAAADFQQQINSGLSNVIANPSHWKGKQ
jgi:hypothetical protein